MTIAPNISKTLMELTGEPRVELAIFGLLKDAIEHRIEKIEGEIGALEKKYRMPFEQFKERFASAKTPDSYSHAVETDFLEWEGLMSRLRKYQSSLTSLAL